MGFQGKSLSNSARPTALITGASRGLGSYLAKSFWENGYNLILVSRQKHLVEDVYSKLILATYENKHAIEGSKQDLSVYCCDFRNESEIDDLVKTLSKNHANINVLINNAAIQGPLGLATDIWNTNSKSYRDAIQVDLLAPIELASRLLSLLANSLENANLDTICDHQGWGQASIINISGGGATAPRTNFSAYATAKAGLVRFSETLAEEVRESGIRVNCIAPGAMKTSMTDEILEHGAEVTGAQEIEVAKRVITEGGPSMQRVADLALFLAGPESKRVTGKLISALWDNWREIPCHIDEVTKSDIFTLRRLAGRDRNMLWADL